MEVVPAKALLSQLLVDGTPRPPFQLKDGIIFYKDRIWLGSNHDLKRKLLTALHDSPIGGHSGALAPFQKLRPLFYWLRMRADVLNHVKSYVVCAQAKADRAGSEFATAAFGSLPVLGGCFS